MHSLSFYQCLNIGNCAACDCRGCEALPQKGRR
nr:MAG TPA: hypothetical protein [Caudoviricetes sp.]